MPWWILKMQIMALASDAFGGYGGVARYNRNLALCLTARDDVREFAILPRLAPEVEPLPPKVRQAPPCRARLRYALAAAAGVARRRPAILISANIYHTPLTRVLARPSGARMISVLHGIEVWKPLSGALLKALEASDTVFCASRDTEARILAQCPALEGRTSVTFNTVGGAFHPGDRAAARRRFGVEDAFVVLTVARLDTRKGADGRFYKGHDRVIPLLKDLPVGRPVVYLVAGIGGDRTRLEMVAREAGVADRVRFLGKVSDADLPALYRAADLFALPSTGEGFGIVFLEAMASGVPAIGLDVGGASDALSAHPLGMAVSAGDFAAGFRHAASAALRLGDEARTALGKAVHTRFGIPAFRARIDAAIEALAPG